MKRRDFLSGLAASAALSGPALAQDYVGSVIAQLRAQGFRAVGEERTLLGRVRITATRKDGRREIIINPNNGEILRDLWTPSDGGSRQLDTIDDKSGRGNDGGNSGSGDGDDDENDEDDEGDSDNSGSGGGNSGGSGGNDDDNDEDEGDDGDDGDEGDGG